MELKQAYLNYYSKVNKALFKGKMFVKLENTIDEGFKPLKKYDSDAGWDCRARINEAIVLQPGKRVKVPLGFGINIPLNHTGDLRPRSGLTDKSGVVTAYGTIDTGYIGEVKATIFNFGEEAFTIHPMDRIAQLVVLPTVQKKSFSQKVHELFYSVCGIFKRKAFGIQLELVDKLVELERGTKGHGSSGVK
ncbi:dUTP diphosphatase [Priestia megaterium]|uniref:dUTP diphosphatase n=1 Tax=Priestia megaterium TaxID=1404 RepID=UPI000D5248A6|nr:dUTP diphosphatase [Priestia megaterium]PVC74926.1 dUTP diphosphatase [Priestia megaterium]PVC75144.1 dUTP diphosphatase [Priestia megaterium]